MKKYKSFEYELTPFATDEDEQALMLWIDNLGKHPTEIPDVDDQHYDKWCCEYDFARVDTLVLPKSIKRIGKCAFAQSELKNVVASGVEVIDELAFYNTKRMQSISAPNCRTLVADCFNHSNVQELDLSSVESVGRYCFYDMARIRTIKLPNLRQMEPYAIYGNDSLTEVDLGMLENAEFSIVTLNKNLYEITAKFLKSQDALAIHSNSTGIFLTTNGSVSVRTENPLSTCYDSETIKQASTRDVIEYQYQHPSGFKFSLVEGLDEAQTQMIVSQLNTLFNSYIKLGKIPQSENAQKDESACDALKFLKDIYLPEEIACIEDYAFAKCYGLESVIAPGVKAINDHAFYCDGALRYVDISNCIRLENDAFNGAGYDTYTKLFAPEVRSVGKHAFWQTGFVCIDLPHCVEVATTAIEENEKLMFVRVASLTHEKAINLNPNLVKLNVETKSLPLDKAVYGCPCVSSKSKNKN